MEELLKALLSLYLIAALLSLAHVLIVPAGFFRLGLPRGWRR